MGIWRNRATVFILLSGLFLVACGGIEPAVDPEGEETATPRPTATETATVVATPTPLPPPSPPATATAVPQPNFTFTGSNPTIAHETSKFINPGAVLYHNGQYHMFPNMFSSWPGEIGVGYYTSADGLAWEAASEGPVFHSSQAPYADPGADVSSVYVTDDGTWVLIFHTVGGSGGSVIGRATASAPTGPWTADPDPILEPGPSDAWDGRDVTWPNVIRTEGGFVMYYTGANSFGRLGTGRAASPDGLTWTKYDDPATDDPPFAASDPIFPGTSEGDGAWESGETQRAEVQAVPGGWVMVYAGAALNRRGLAFSRDGIQWTRYAKNPIITPTDFPVSGSTWDTALLYANGIYFYYMEIGRGSTDIFAAVHEGDLPIPAGEPAAAAPPQHFDLAALRAEQRESGDRVVSFLEEPSTSLLLYALPAGGTDAQSPHGDDEIYYVLAGEATLQVEEETIPVAPGSLVYVRALAPHTFTEIESDLQVLVFFAKGDTAVAEEAWLARSPAEMEKANATLFDLPSLRLELRTVEEEEGGAEDKDTTYLILEGNGRVQSGGETIEIEPGSVVYMEAGTPHTLRAAEAPLRFLAFKVPCSTNC